MKGAFCFLASNDFMPGIIVSLKTLGPVTKFPMLILDLGLTEENKAIVAKHGGIVRQIDPVYSKQVTLQSWHPTRDFAQNCFRKLNMWKFTEYDKVIFLDGDIFITQSIDELFYVPHDFSAVSTTKVVFDGTTGDVIRAGWSRSHFNAGLMIIKPDLKVYKDLMARKDTDVPKDDASDEGFLNVYYKDRWNRLPPCYNAGRMVFQYMPEIAEQINVKVIHYASEKPWLRRNPEDREPIDQLWWEEYGTEYDFPDTPRVDPEWWAKLVQRNKGFLKHFQEKRQSQQHS